MALSEKTLKIVWGKFNTRSRDQDASKQRARNVPLASADVRGGLEDCATSLKGKRGMRESGKWGIGELENRGIGELENRRIGNVERESLKGGTS